MANAKPEAPVPPAAPDAEIVKLYEQHIAELEKGHDELAATLKARDAEIAVLRSRLRDAAPAVSGTTTKIKARANLVVAGVPVPRGAVVDVPSEQAASLIRGGAAEAFTG